ncbi:MAG: hypothetical protein EOM70_06465 [Clostridia bacterium]|nr:hypothetical protein [Clostridia bacterium]
MARTLPEILVPESQRQVAMHKQDPLKNYQQPLLSHNQMVIKPVDQVICPEAVYMLGQIRHPALPALRGVEAIELDDQPPRDCFLFDFLPGTSLDRLSSAEKDGWPLPAQIKFFAELARVVDFLHAQCEPGLLHLDIKPANVLLGPDLRPRLIDFGAMQHLAPVPSEDHLAAATPACPDLGIACTPAFAAPEVLQGRPVMASDFYAIGLTMMAALTGIPSGDEIKSRLPDLLRTLPPPVSSVLVRCLQTSPQDRYGKASELARDLDKAAERIQSPGQSLVPDEGSVNSLQPEAGHPSLPESDTTPGQMEQDLRSAGLEQPSRLICVWDGPEFGCELAVQLKQYYSSVLVIDCDLMNPQADLLLGKKNRPGLADPRRSADNLNLVLKEALRGTLNSRRLRELAWPALSEPVDVLVFGDNLDEYDHIPADSLLKLLEIARQSYPAVILLCNRFIYDAFTCLGLMTADQILVPLPGHAAAFRSINRSIDFLALRQQIDPLRVHIIAFPFDERADLSLGTLDVLSRNRLIGSVRSTLARQRQKGTAKPYATDISPINAKEYDGIIARLGAIARKEEANANRHLTRPVRRTVRFLSRQAHPAQ